jgi:molecular chaperone DnaJ
MVKKGLPDLRSRRLGDQVVRVLIEIPRRMSSQQAELLREFAKTEDRNVLPESKGFLEKLKDFWANLNE